jgi:hypothetical protein
MPARRGPRQQSRAGPRSPWSSPLVGIAPAKLSYGVRSEHFARDLFSEPARPLRRRVRPHITKINARGAGRSGRPKFRHTTRGGADYITEIRETLVICVGGDGRVELQAVNRKQVGKARWMGTQRQDHGRGLRTFIRNLVAARIFIEILFRPRKAGSLPDMYQAQSGSKVPMFFTRREDERRTGSPSTRCATGWGCSAVGKPPSQSSWSTQS